MNRFEIYYYNRQHDRCKTVLYAETIYEASNEAKRRYGEDNFITVKEN